MITPKNIIYYNLILLPVAGLAAYFEALMYFFIVSVILLVFIGFFDLLGCLRIVRKLQIIIPEKIKMSQLKEGVVEYSLINKAESDIKLNRIFVIFQLILKISNIVILWNF